MDWKWAPGADALGLVGDFSEYQQMLCFLFRLRLLLNFRTFVRCRWMGSLGQSVREVGLRQMGDHRACESRWIMCHSTQQHCQGAPVVVHICLAAKATARVFCRFVLPKVVTPLRSCLLGRIT